MTKANGVAKPKKVRGIDLDKKTWKYETTDKWLQITVEHEDGKKEAIIVFDHDPEFLSACEACEIDPSSYNMPPQLKLL